MEPPGNQEDHIFPWNDEIFETQHAGAVARLYRDIGKFASADPNHYNHLSRYELWGEVTKAGKKLVTENALVTGEDLLRHLWSVAREIVTKWERIRNENSH